MLTDFGKEGEDAATFRLELTPSLCYLTGFSIGNCASQVRSGYVLLISSSTHPGFLLAFSRAVKKCKANSFGVYAARRIKTDGVFSYRWFCWATFPRIYSEYFQSDPGSMISRIGNDDESVYSYLAGLADAEGNWQVSRSHLDRVHFEFRLFSTNRELLSVVADQLANRGFSCSVRLKERAGSRRHAVPLKRDYWLLRITKRNDIARLATTLLTHSLHPEKVERMKFILDHKDTRNWSSLENSWQGLRRTTTKEVQQSVELARIEYENSHQPKVGK